VDSWIGPSTSDYTDLDITTNRSDIQEDHNFSIGAVELKSFFDFFLKIILYYVEGLKDLRNLFANHEVKLRLAAKMSANIAQMG